MKWFKKLFAANNEKPMAVGNADATPAKVLRPALGMPRPDPIRISTDNVRAHCDRLDREAERTGNKRLRAQAANIRSRLT